MKKYNLIKTVLILIFSVLVIQGCKDKDLEAPFARETAESFFTEGGTENYNKAVVGAYSKLTQFYKYHSDQYLHPIWLMRDDLLTSNLPDPYEVFNSLNATNGSTLKYYQISYQLINRVNLVLINIKNHGDKVFVGHETLKDTYEGELRFMRGYMYYHLAVNYGTPPLSIEPITDLAYLPTNSAVGEAMDLAISELTKAASLLPDSWEGIDAGRATKGVALGILGKALLHRGTSSGYNATDLTLALEAFDQISGYSLLPNFADNFDGENENTAESLFEMQFGTNSEANNIWLSVDDEPFVGDLAGYWGFFNKHWSAFGFKYILPTSKLESVFEAGDPRKDMTLRDGQIKKYIDKDVIGGDGASSLNNARVLRYADVLLMKAEAMLMSGGDKGEAIGLINEIRKRARESVLPASAIPADRSTTETNEATILQWIMDERVLELAGEEIWRWYDLIRWHKAGKIDLSTWDFSSIQTVAFDVNKHLLLPFPASEVSMSSGNLIQNPGY